MSHEILHAIQGEDYVFTCDHRGCTNRHVFLGVDKTAPESWPGYDPVAAPTPAAALARHLRQCDQWVTTDVGIECPIDHTEIDYEMALADQAAAEAAAATRAAEEAAAEAEAAARAAEAAVAAEEVTSAPATDFVIDADALDDADDGADADDDDLGFDLDDGDEAP